MDQPKETSKKLIDRHVGLRIKFVILFLAVVVFLLAFNVAWRHHSQQYQAEREMLEKAEVLSNQMDSVWDFMERNQSQFKVDKDGLYSLYCVVAAKSISKSFTAKTDYIIHYTNTNTRKKADAPDAFELEALEALRADAELESYHSFAYDQEGSLTYRFVKPLRVTRACLDCHGEPAGELDPLGFPKEGQKLDDIAGAMSIIMPVDMYMESNSENLFQESVVFALVVFGGLAVIYCGLTRLVIRPIKRLEYAAQSMETRNFNVELNDVGDRDEIEDLAAHFSSMARQLQSLYDNLEKQVDIRTKELGEANGMLAQANTLLESQHMRLEEVNEKLRDESRYKSDFLAIMSHELRTPLTSILAFTDIWESSLSCDDGVQRIALNEIKESGRILLQMVNNILEMARVEAGKMKLNLEAIDMTDLIGSVEGTERFIAEKRGINLYMKVDTSVPIIVADFEKLRRIIENLTNNAIKFTQRGGSVLLNVSYEGKRNEILISVKDTGIGIGSEDLPDIFERFSQVDRSSYRRRGGSGLGLAVVKELVDLHYGSIEVKSVYRKGSVFSVRIPAGSVGQ